MTRSKKTAHCQELTPGEPSRRLPTDAPISKAVEDILGRTGFANEMAEVIAKQRTDESVVLALRGDWGSGKSSLKNLIVESLRENFQKKVKVLEFNPWQWGAENQISRAFFREIAATLGQTDQSPQGRRRAYSFRQYANLLTSLSEMVKPIGQALPNMFGWLNSFGFAVAGGGFLFSNFWIKRIAGCSLICFCLISVVAKILQHCGFDKNANKPLEFFRADLEEQLKSLTQNLLIIIDDIDRLEPEQIRLVVRLVKSNANLPRLSYLLLFQRSVMEKALDEISDDDGRRYLEKIVQASFDVPAVEGARIEVVVLKELEKILNGAFNTHNGSDRTRWENIWHDGLRKLFTNLRDINRFLSVVDIYLNLHRGQRFLEINCVDFIAIEALRVFEPDVFTAISRAKELLIGEEDHHEEMRESIRAITDKMEGERQNPINVILKELFPRFAWALGGPSHYMEGKYQWPKERRVCSERYFDRYFMLRLPDGEISDSEFAEFLDLNNKTKIVESFQNFNKKNQDISLLNRLYEIRSNLPMENIPSLFPALIDIGDTLDGSPFLESSVRFFTILRTVDGYLRSIKDIQSRGEILLNAMSTSTGLAIPSILTKQEEDFRKQKQSDAQQILNDECLIRVNKLLLERIKDSSDAADIFLANLHLSDLLYRWRGLAGEDEPRKWIADVVKDVELLPKLLTRFILTEQRLVSGKNISSGAKKFNFTWFEDFADINQVNEAVEKIDESRLTIDEREVLAAYRQQVDQNK